MQRPSHPPLHNRARKLVVLDMDALFHPPDSTHSFRLIHEGALKKLINYAKENDQVHLIFISDKYNNNEIKQLIKAQTDAESFTYHGLNIRMPDQGPDWDYISHYCETACILPENVIWVDVKLNKLKDAAAKQYMPVLVPSYKEAASQKTIYPSSRYLDFIPVFFTRLERSNEAVRTATSLVTAAYPSEKEKCDALIDFYETLSQTQPTVAEERVRPADRVRSVAKPLSKMEFEALRKEFSEGKFRKLLNTRAEIVIITINAAKNFEELQSAYLLVQKERAVSKTEMGIGKVTGKEGATNRWQRIATALQEKALEIARSEIRMPNRSATPFGQHHQTYEAIFSLKVHRGLFARSAMKEEYKKLINIWKHHHLAAPK